MRTFLLNLTAYVFVLIFNSNPAHSETYFVYLVGQDLEPLAAIDLLFQNNQATVVQISYRKSGADGVHMGIFDALLRATFLAQPHSDQLVANMDDVEMTESTERFKLFIALHKIELKRSNIGVKDSWSLNAVIRKTKRTTALEKEESIKFNLRPRISYEGL